MQLGYGKSKLLTHAGVYGSYRGKKTNNCVIQTALEYLDCAITRRLLDREKFGSQNIVL